MASLNPKQRRFVAEYLKDQNGTQAAIRAGYSKKTANEQASQLLAKLNIRKLVDEKLSKIEADGIADRKERQRFWTETMKDVGIEMPHRLKGSELLGRSQGDFVERIEHNVSEDLRSLVMKSLKDAHS